MSNAREASEEAISLAQKSGNQSLYAKGLCNIADVNREIGETEAKETITASIKFCISILTLSQFKHHGQ